MDNDTRKRMIKGLYHSFRRGIDEDTAYYAWIFGLKSNKEVEQFLNKLRG